MIKTFTKKDLETKQAIIIVDRLICRSDYWRIKKLLTRESLIVIMNIASSIKKKSWFKVLLQNNHVREFSWHVFSFSERYKAEDQAFDSVEAVYSLLTESGKIPVDSMKRLYGHPDVALAFKKELILNLVAYFRAVNCVNNLHQLGHSIKFLPSFSWRNIDRWISNAKITLPERVIISKVRRNTVTICEQLNYFREKFFSLLLVILIVPWILTRIRNIHPFAFKPRKVQLAIRLYNTDWHLWGEGTQEVDWLLDGRALNAKNTIFVAENTLDKEYESEIKRRGYFLVQQGRQKGFKEVSMKFIFKTLIGKSITTVLPLFIKCLRTPPCLMKSVHHGWMQYLLWQNFLLQFQPKYYFACHDIDYTHIFRNILLKSGGCESWYFDHSNSKVQMYEMNSQLSGREALRSYMKFDKEIHWGRQLVELAKNHRVESSSFEAYGPIWSSKIEKVNSIEMLIAEKWGNFNEGYILSAFSTSSGIHAINSEVIHHDFIFALMNLLNNPIFSNLKILFKPKHKNYEHFPGQEGTDICKIYQEFIQHPRVLIVDPRFSAVAVMHYSDIVVSMAFASPTVEALMGGKRAIYYDANNQYPNSFFEKFPKTVAHSEDEFKDLLVHWLEMSDDVFLKYLDQYVAPEYGGRIKNPAIEIIREGLSV